MTLCPQNRLSTSLRPSVWRSKDEERNWLKREREMWQTPPFGWTTLWPHCLADAAAQVKHGLRPGDRHIGLVSASAPKWRAGSAGSMPLVILNTSLASVNGTHCRASSYAEQMGPSYTRRYHTSLYPHTVELEYRWKGTAKKPSRI